VERSRLAPRQLRPGGVRPSKMGGARKLSGIIRDANKLGLGAPQRKLWSKVSRGSWIPSGLKPSLKGQLFWHD